MVADPYRFTMNFTRRVGGPVVHSATFSADDVANNFATNIEDGLAFVDLPKQLGPLFLDPSSFATEDGADTTQLQLFANGQPTAWRYQLVSLASAANVARVPATPFAPGTRIAFKQLA